MKDDEQIRESSGLQTILLWVTLGALGFIGTATWSNSLALARLEGASMGRPEIEQKLSDIKAIQAATDVEIVKLKIQVALPANKQ